MGPVSKRIRAEAPPEPSLQGCGHVVGQRPIRLPGGAGCGFGPLALPAARLAEGPEQHRRATRPAPVEVRDPVVGALAVGAHEHLLVIDDAALPRARALAGIGLASAAVVAGHGATYSSASAFWYAARSRASPSAVRTVHR